MLAPKLLELARRLPAGLDDPRAAEKLWREYAELLATDLADREEVLLECADNLYYCAKAVHNKLMTEAEADAHMARVAQVSGFSLNTIEAAALTKYEMRARPGNPKNDAAERAAVAHLL